MQTLLEQFHQVGFAAWMSTLFSLLYIFFAVQNKSICFVFGLISSSFWGYESFFNLNLKFDAFLQVFYVLMSIWGIYQWQRGGTEQKERHIGSLGVSGNSLWIGFGVVLSIVIYFLVNNMISTEKAFLDLATTIFSIIATFLLVFRYIDQWIYWIVIDLCYIYIYIATGAELFALIMLINTVLAIKGFFNWHQIYLDKV